MSGIVAWGRVVISDSAGRRVASALLVGTGSPDLAAVDLLARYRLWARRFGGSVELTGLSPELEDLLELVGLLGQVCGQAEGSEEVGVEKGMEPGDPSA